MKIPLGAGAYKRTSYGESEIRLVNRYVETNPVDQKGGAALIARPGTSELATFGNGPIRRCFNKQGLFNSDLFVVSDATLYRYTADGTSTPITGTVSGTGSPAFAWMKGIGYQYLFIADGLSLQYYAGGSQATGTLSLPSTVTYGAVLSFGPFSFFGQKPSPVGKGVLSFGGIAYAPTVSNLIVSQIFELDGVYYSWLAAPSADASGTSDDPWAAKRGANDAESLANMANLLNFNGVAGVDFSTNLPGANAFVTAAATATSLVVTAISDNADGNTITTSVFAGGSLSWGAATLVGGGIHALVAIAMPDGKKALSLASLAGFVLVSIAESQEFFFILPGEVMIDPLNFAEKEAAPDSIIDMLTVGDFVFLIGKGETEAWYATGDALAQFAPQQGRAYQRGVVEGTPVIVKDGVVLVGNDGIVYGIDGAGLQRLSDHGIEERIRRQLRREQGLTP